MASSPDVPASDSDKTSETPAHATAIVYDFDGTLASGNVQEHRFLPDMGVDKEVFWEEVNQYKQAHDADEILVYMWRMLEWARKNKLPITRETLTRYGATVPLFKGLETWFDRINAYAAERNLNLQHYIISSGNEEIIGACPVAKHFTQIYGSKFIYDEEGHAAWPGAAVNYTTKTQYLFRINKGVENHWERQRINTWMPMDERPVPFQRMLFIGDGETDIPSMKMVRHQGAFPLLCTIPTSGRAAVPLRRSTV